MSSSLVWVLLYYEGQDEPKGLPIPIEVSKVKYGGIIAGLAEAVKAKLKPKLDHAPVDEISVFPPDATPPFSRDKDKGNQNSYKPSKPLKTTPLTSDDHPLIVVAPAPQQQPQQPATSEQTLTAIVERLEGTIKEHMDNRTKHVAMSEASMQFAEAILNGYGLRVVLDSPVMEPGSKEDPPLYSRKVVGDDAHVSKEDEHAAMVWFNTHLLAGEREYGLKVVTGEFLPDLKANRRSTRGKSDIAIGVLKEMKFAEVFSYVNGLIELKTDKSPIKPGQCLLQLLSLSTTSTLQRGVALLATDCNTKWETFHFSEKNVVLRRPYEHGQKAWEDFMELIRSAEDRKRKYPELAAIGENVRAEEDDQNLDGFDLPEQDRKKLKALEDHAMLEQLADHLGDIYGERPVVPSWARAEARIPGYYV